MIKQAIGEIECVAVTRPSAQHDREQLVVTQARRAESFQLLAWPIVRRHIFHFIYTLTLMRRWSPRTGATAWLLAALVVSSCAEPPNKEIGQAQGAIDAARAAGAEQYAAPEYTAATTALKQANEAVVQRDYRLALNFALESREHSQNAARDAAETRARIRGDVERSLAEVTALLAQARTRLSTQGARFTRSRLRAMQAEVTQASTDLQEAVATMRKGDYPGAQPMLSSVKSRLEKIIVETQPAGATQSQRRRG